MELKYVGQTIWQERRYEYKVDDNCVIYCTFQKNDEEAYINFIVGLPGATSSMSKEDSAKYRLGIEGDIGAFTGEHPDRICINFYEKNAFFGDFYTAEGTPLKKMVIHNDKYHMFDGTAYYEVTSDANQVGSESTETFVSKDEAHKYMPLEIISEKEKYEKIALEIFETLR